MGVKVKEWKGGDWVFINHKGKRKAIKCANRKAAEVVATKIDAALKLGQAGVLDGLDRPPVPTFKEYAERWLAAAEARLKPSSVIEYRSRLRVRLVPELGSLPLTAITRDTVRTLVARWSQDRNRRTAQERGISRRTVREALRTLSAILSTAEEDGLIPANPARRMGRFLPKATDDEIEVFTREELVAILAAAEEVYPTTYYPFIFCLARAGLRLGEAIALEWADVDFADRVLLVRRTERNGQVSAPKNSKGRRVDMSAQLTSVLAGLKTCQEAEAVVNGSTPPTRMFLSPSGPVDEDYFRNSVWASLLRRVGLRYRKPHCLRHTFASLLIAAGEDIVYVSKQLGHDSPALTLKVYAHLVPRGERRGVDRLDEATGRNPRATGAPELAESAREFK